jgi:hypothetical protein
MKAKQRNYKALLTIYGLDTMNHKDIVRLESWLIKITKSIGNEQYAKVARFRLMK